MRRQLKMTVLLGITGLIPALALRAQQPPDTARTRQPAPAATAKAETSTDPIDRIKEEGLKRSQVMATLSYLTDVIGPRLTGSPNLKRANEWTRDRLAAWGLSDAHLEAWGPFGRGWTLKRFSAQVIEPQCIPLIAFPKAWSPGTDGPLAAPVVYFDAKTEADFAAFKGKIKGAIVLVAPATTVSAHFEPLGKRKTDSELLELADAPEPPARGGRRGGQGQPGPAQGQGQRQGRGRLAANGAPAAPGAGAAPAPPAGGRFQMTPERRAQMELAAKKLQFASENGAAMILEPSRNGDGGTLFVQSATIPGAPIPGMGQGQGQGQPQARRVSVYDKNAPKIVPQVVMAQEHYNRLVRMIEQGEKLKIAVDLAVQFHDDDLMAYNTVAEIPGTDKKDELVMLGGHMDSWHSGTGATDNAAGVSVGMEAVRILKALDLKPRRTIRIALWTGEEEGLLGSRAYVTKHFGRSPAGMFGPQSGSSETTSDSAPKPEFAKFSAYFNLDNGTGKVRGIYLQGNEAARPIFRKWLQPFRQMGATTISLSNTGGTDHQSFDGIGLPGFQFIQDEIEYDTRTHHSNQDVYDRIQAEDMKQAAVIMASFIYNAANMEEKIPRKPAPASTAPVRAAATP
ncbi:MAG: M20/M25/M40 family metallo-hydrolase [Isosphaeraceae bacterium]